MIPIPYWHIDAFSARPFGGNQAAVMLFEAAPDEATMQAIAAENMFAETAFLVPLADGSADFALRWFTPEAEVALCGHATLASGHVILTRDPGRASVTFATRKAGVLAVHRADHGYDLALPAIPMADPAPAELTQGLGAVPVEALANDQGYILCRFADEAAVRALRPDMAALAAHGDTMFICTAPGTRTAVVSRVFVPGAGVPEDSVTGSAHAVLAPFWAARLGRTGFTAHQASVRGGDLACRVEGDRAILGGQCVTVVAGTFYLEG